jgi:hypothetical protein
MDSDKGKVGEAMKRDWEQTKRDIKKDTGKELNQDAGDTLGQATGKKPIPPANVPNPPDFDEK